MARDLTAAIRNQPIIKTDYDWDPIHMPGSVQTYGVLVVADPHSRRIKFVSDNVAEMFKLSPADLLDKPYPMLAEHDRERRVMQEQIEPNTILFPNPVRLTINGRAADAVFHAHAGLHYIEIEPVLTEDKSYEELADRAVSELFNPASVEDLYSRACDVIREVSGFDRVMLYKFDARCSGQVLAEARLPGVDSFMGMFFPSSDIPARMRELFLTNFTRYIPEISCKRVPLTGVYPGGGRPDSAHPVDMTHANLRSVADCHVGYLENMKVGASMSFSINVDGRLWGLFACHHYAGPRYISYDRRVVCEQTAMMFIFKLVSMTSIAARLEHRRRAVTTLAETAAVGLTLAKRIANATAEWEGTSRADTAQSLVARALAGLQSEVGWLMPPDEAGAPTPAAPDGKLSASQQLLLDLVEADSAAVMRHGRVYRIGDAPSEMAVFGICSMFGRELPDIRGGELNVFATDSLSAVVPAAEDIKDRASGVCAAALSLSSPAYILWFRREQLVHASWAGNPDKVGMERIDMGLNPANSFETWKKDIKNLSMSWVIEDVQIADEFAALIRDLEHGQGMSRHGASGDHRAHGASGDHRAHGASGDHRAHASPRPVPAAAPRPQDTWRTPAQAPSHDPARRVIRISNF